LKSIESGAYNVKSGLIYNDLFSSCEKIGDHVINVSEAMAGEM
jgi:phosphate:Na+ symporter